MKNKPKNSKCIQVHGNDYTWFCKIEIKWLWYFGSAF